MATKYFAVGFLFLFGLISLYFGIGGSLKTENYNQVSIQYNFNDTTKVEDFKTKLEFKNFAELALYKEDEKSAKIFPFLSLMPDFLGIILTACFFGMIGGIISILKKIALENKNIEDTNYISIPLLSFFTGLVILGLNYIIPTILVAGENKIRPITLIFTSLFAGIYTPQFFKFITSIAQSKFFKNEK
jgi:hypothetical protein